MAKLVSSWADGKTLPETYVLPPEKRPGDQCVVPTPHDIPVIDLNSPDQSNIVQQIIDSMQNFGFFQVINHGVPMKLMDDTRGVLKALFELPSEEKAKFCYTSSADYDKEAVHHWRDAVGLKCAPPLEECMLDWPANPLNYREVVKDYVVNLRELGSRILELIGEGLGLQQGYFEELSKGPMMLVNHYPACPDPSLTLGSGRHCDPNLITILLQDDVPGLQVFKDGKWIGVDPMPNAFVINVGHHLNIVSNGRLKSVEHRVVTNKTRARTTVAYLVAAKNDCVLEPANDIVGPKNPPLYKKSTYGEMLKSVRAVYTGEIDCALKPLRVEA